MDQPNLPTAESKVNEMILLDPATADVVRTMRNQGRTWSRICYCFRGHMKELGMDTAIEHHVHPISG